VDNFIPFKILIKINMNPEYRILFRQTQTNRAPSEAGAIQQG
jgi:hypothetical protein